jgi:hypothetical protein
VAASSVCLCVTKAFSFSLPYNIRRGALNLVKNLIAIKEKSSKDVKFGLAAYDKT